MVGRRPTILKRLGRLSPFLIAATALAAVACSSGGASPETTGDAPAADTGTPGVGRLIETATALPAVAIPDNVPAGMEPVWETFADITREYVERDKIDPEQLARGAIRGMLDALDDPYTAYVTPEGYRRQLESFQGDFEGIGARIDNTPDGTRIIVVAPIPGTPAERAGLKAGDIIIAVDGEDTEGWSVIDAVARIRGPGGTPVELTVQRLAEADPRIISIVRGTIETPSVFIRNLRDDGNTDAPPYSVIRISQFTGRTADEIQDALKQVSDAGSTGIILDVRGNPGGLLAATVAVGGQFLDGGLVTYEINGRGVRRDWPATNGGLALDTPLVILVDQFSASGSEVLAAALQDRGRAAVIGVKSFGKGSVNVLRELQNDAGGLYLTIGRWYTPSGDLIEGDGVKPDVVVEIPSDAREDLQLQAAIKQLDFQTATVSVG